ncbi:hypothetical protein GGTG_11868 [Gaeumannomyces tritici R3-111a-1]|uniref:Uncharacterized protein n=1 Tax=Gaeumannomyces tritici (strain R3-111a-1) TaxID=644352 RepID=J3PED7_GAET3|nr:hypothetical protein GGTG_11868 [Gaeumannomyces tritici R3-111a-1]EJT70845.1 hypothetical protein GGTG_11868 [Gaeumannomyces tritici R3-111a-1]
MALSAGAIVGVVLGVLVLAFALIVGLRFLWIIHELRKPWGISLEHLHDDSEAGQYTRHIFGQYLEAITPTNEQHIYHFRNALVDDVATFISNHLDLSRYTYGKCSVDLAKFVDAAGDLEDWNIFNEYEE